MWRDPYGPSLPERFLTGVLTLLVVAVGLRLMAGLLDAVIAPLILVAIITAMLLWFFRRPYY